MLGGEHRAAGDEAQVPAPAEQEQGHEQDLVALRVARRPRARDAATSTPVPRKIVWTVPNALGDPARHRREREHPGDVPADHDADGAEAVAVVGQVEGRHRHDQDHRRLAGDQRRHSGQDGRPERGSPGPRFAAGASVGVDGRSRERARTDPAGGTGTSSPRRRRRRGSGPGTDRPARAGRTTARSAGRSARATGPTMPPTVDPHTTSPIANARRLGATRSAAA